MAEGLDGGDLAGHDIYTVFAFVAEIGVLHRVFDPLRRSEGLAAGDEIFADLRVPHVAERVLRQAALLAPRLNLQA